MIGKTISHYKILEKLGEGGMGVVYKAEDTKLKRTVALKFLPQDLSRDDESKERFIHEAQAASALDHNNICTIYEIDETDDGQMFIAMACYDGETLKKKVERGPQKLEDAIDIAMQVAQGLARAHEEKIVHRDIKPANIMITHRDEVKIVDFGLAKLAGRTMLTKEGTTLGTVAYMSPEQAQGTEVDHRTDIWALGAVLYEMITGRQPFEGDYEQAVMYSIMNEDAAPMTGLRTGVPMELERTVLKSLEKAPDERYQSATELLVDLKKLSKGLDVSQSKSVPTAQSAVTEGKKVGTKSKRGLYTFGAIGIAGLIALFIYFQIGRETKSIRLTNPTKITHAIGVENYPTWSPDGSKIAYASNQSGKPDIWMKQLSGGEPVNMTKDIAGSYGSPSWSPDRSQIAFIGWQRGYNIFVMPAIGGPPRRVGSTWLLSNPVWSADGTQLAHVRRDSTQVPGAEIYTLSTYEKREVTLPGEQYERAYLSWSPNGDYFAYTDADNLYAQADISAIKIVRITDGKDFQIANESHLDFSPIWSLDGRILYFLSDRGGTPDLWQVKLSAEGKPEGNPEQVSFGLGLQSMAFTADHTKIAFSKEERTQNLWRIPIPKPGARVTKWTDAKQLTFESSTIRSLDISRNGKQVYFASDRSGNWDLWSMPVTGGELRQLTNAPDDDGSVGLSPDGKTLAFVSERSGWREIWTMPAMGGPAKQITNDQSPKYWPRWSPDGQTIAFQASDSNINLNLWVVPAQGGEARQITNVGSVFYPLWWPDGKSLAGSNRGSMRRFPIAGGRPEPLTRPDFKGTTENDLRWSSDNTQIYFIRWLDGALNIWCLSVADGSVRQLTDFSRRYGRLGRSFATDGTYFYFTWQVHTGDIWVMDVEQED